MARMAIRFDTQDLPSSPGCVPLTNHIEPLVVWRRDLRRPSANTVVSTFEGTAVSGWFQLNDRGWKPVTVAVGELDKISLPIRCTGIQVV